MCCLWSHTKGKPAAEFEVTDPNVAINKNANYRSALYLTLQMALREIVGKEKIDDLMQNRSAIGIKLMELASAKASDYGLKLRLADVKDIMFPGEMKKVFSQGVTAQKEGQAALERARGETAALRSLANAARMIDDNPNLLSLRALQSLTDSGSNTLLLGLPNGLLPLLKKEKKRIPRLQKTTRKKSDTQKETQNFWRYLVGKKLSAKLFLLSLPLAFMPASLSALPQPTPNKPSFTP